MIDHVAFEEPFTRHQRAQGREMRIRINPGGHYVTGDDELLVTVLGSCVAACIRDPVAGIGGMNHFMLPQSDSGIWGIASASMRFGNFAMEKLINDILSRGGRRSNLEIKVFGGAAIIGNMAPIGTRNADFVESYLREEGLPIAAQSLRGVHAGGFTTIPSPDAPSCWRCRATNSSWLGSSGPTSTPCVRSRSPVPSNCSNDPEDLACPAKVLVVDDSALMRQLLSELLSSDQRIQVVGVASDPYVAREQIKALNPDVITLDIEMPRMDGLRFLEKLMALRPTPVVVVSTLTQKGTDAVVRALALGAIDCVAKPLLDLRAGMTVLRDELVDKVLIAASSRPMARSSGLGPTEPLAFDPHLSTAGWIVAVGASTGGVEALQALLTAMPATAPAILVTQHMPPGFTTSFARRLDQICAMPVFEATNSQRVMPGHIYIANGSQHLELVRSGAHYACRLHDGPSVSGHRPSVDVLFNSVAAAAGRNAIGVILTGMGQDGAAGLLAMRNAGARTRGQDEASCVIYGMPKAAKRLGAVEAERPLSKMAAEILGLTQERRAPIVT